MIRVSSRGYGLLWDNTSHTKCGDRREPVHVPAESLIDADGRPGGLTGTYRQGSCETGTVVATIWSGRWPPQPASIMLLASSAVAIDVERGAIQSSTVRRSVAHSRERCQSSSATTKSRETAFSPSK